MKVFDKHHTFQVCILVISQHIIWLVVVPILDELSLSLHTVPCQIAG